MQVEVTIKMLDIGTYMSEQTVPTLIGLLLKEPSDEGLHSSAVHLHLLDALKVDALLHC